MAEFYDDPQTGRLMLRGAAGGGGSEFNGLASDSDTRTHGDAYRRYQDAKHAAADRAKREASDAVEQLKAEEAEIEKKIADIAGQTAMFHQPLPVAAEASEPAAERPAGEPA